MQTKRLKLLDWYEPPCVECVEVAIEQGFEASIEDMPVEDW